MILPPTPGEYDLDQLSIALAFRSRAGKEVRLAFVKAVAEWARAAADGGAFDDGPVRVASRGVRFTGVRAQFCIDASRSGQDTLNWLSLVLLDFGDEVHTVAHVVYGFTDAELDTVLGPTKGVSVLVEFPGQGGVIGSSEEVTETPVTYVPPEARPDRSFRSKSFRVLTLL